MLTFILGLKRFIPAKAAMYAALAAAGAGVIAWLRKDAVEDDRKNQEVAYLSGKLKANELESEAEHAAGEKSDDDLISGNSRGGVRDETGEG